MPEGYRHLLAGGLGGTMGAVATCPLEVVKTRLQSSSSSLQTAMPTVRPAFYSHEIRLAGCGGHETTVVHCQQQSRGVLQCFRHIIATEGSRGLFKGLGANLAGVAPSRAIYFFAYGNMKQTLNRSMIPETPAVHILSAVTAAVTTSTLTNPIWFLKTRLQLDERCRSQSWQSVARQVYKSSGVKGFYKGISASYVGSIETVIYFVTYEALRAQVCSNNLHCSSDFGRFMVCAAVSKIFASCLSYPHEVVRTRLRQQGSRYNGFAQTLALVAKEEGFAALYRGLYVQMLRQIPNSAIMMATYELVLHLTSSDSNVA